MTYSNQTVTTQFEDSLILGYRAKTTKERIAFLMGYRFALLDTKNRFSEQYEDVEFLFDLECATRENEGDYK